MKFTTMRLKFVLATALLILAFNNNSRAGGFPVRPRSFMLSPSVNYFYANKGWDSLRVQTPFKNGGQFESISYSLYAEYGISKRFSAVAVMPYVMNHYVDDTGYESRTNGLTDLELGVKYYLANINYIYYFSLQGTFIMPTYRNNVNLGYGQEGAEVKISFAGSGKFLGKNYYFTVENGIRQYFGDSGPLQDRYTATVGMTLDRRFKHQISASFGGFYSTSSLSSGYDPTKIAANKNFAFNQVSASYGYSFNKRLSLFLTVGTFVDGRNTGHGSSGSAAFIIKPF